MSNMRTFVESKAFLGIILGVASFVLLVATFSAGAAVGARKARFSYAWGENYHKNFAGPRGGFMNGLMGDFMGGDLIEGHGASGRILKIDLSGTGAAAVVMQGRNNIERIVIVSADTEVRLPNADATIRDLRVDDFAVVIGEPNDAGQIEAKFIRVVPAPNARSTAPAQFPRMMMR